MYQLQFLIHIKKAGYVYLQQECPEGSLVLLMSKWFISNTEFSGTNCRILGESVVEDVLPEGQISSRGFMEVAKRGSRAAASSPPCTGFG